ncbi:MAG: hypothetical protein LBT81_05945 [Helicobacteraceae bacterium]|jgi:hypothetical protein|nr:hypothetical protein [Helicobacteraceae bacterium]
MKNVLFAALLLLGLAYGSATADRANYLLDETLRETLTMLGSEDEIAYLCELCGEKNRFLSELTLLMSQESTPHVQYIAVNGAGIDLAHTFVKRGEKWYNLAILRDLDVSDLSKWICISIDDKFADGRV